MTDFKTKCLEPLTESEMYMINMVLLLNALKLCQHSHQSLKRETLLKLKGSSSNWLTQITSYHCVASFLGPSVLLEFLKSWDLSNYSHFRNSY